MRQTDSLSFVLGYFKYGANFFEPRGLNLESINGKGVSEFPILYFLTAGLYHLFGEHEFILRLLNVLIVSMGFFFLFRLIRNLLQNLFYAYVFTFLFLSSTVLIYYANNFLSDPSALGFVLIAWYYFFSYLESKKRKSLIFSFSFFTLSALLKITFLINPIAAFLTIIYVYFDKNKPMDLKNAVFPFLLFIICLLISLSWVLYVVYYNKTFENYYFTTVIRPIWKMSDKSINEVWDYITNFWYSKYYFQSTFHLFAVIIVCGIFCIKRIYRELFIVSKLLLVGSLIYVLSFYEMFKDHDYYFITVLPTIILILLSSFQGIMNKYPKIINHVVVKLILLAICILSINYSRTKINQRYMESVDVNSIIGRQLATFNDYLMDLHIDEYAKVIIIQDISRNGGLYFLKREGWTLKELNEKSIKEYVNLGAEYLIITDLTLTKKISNLGERIGEKNGVVIYKL